MATSLAPPHRGRFEQLDALRGIAALTVVFSHFTLLQPLLGLRHTPLRLILGGHEAVILFFVLSGFVLTLQLTSARQLSYGSYVVKRICRIYIPYIAAVCMGALLFSESYGGNIDWAGDWFNGAWHGRLNLSDLYDHLLFLGRFDTSRIIPVVWSLVYEMRISLVFPLVAWAVMRFPSIWCMAAACMVSAGVLYWTRMTGGNAMANSVHAAWPMTLHYLLMFVVGATLARHRNALAGLFRSAASRWLLTGGSIALYCLSRPLTIRINAPVGDFLFDWIVTLAVAGIVVSAIVNARMAAVLRAGALQFLGRISYSLYLFHTLVLLSVFHLLGRNASPGTALLVAAALVIPVAYLAYLLLEWPSIQLGQRIAAQPRLVERKA